MFVVQVRAVLYGILLAAAPVLVSLADSLDGSVLLAHCGIGTGGEQPAD